MIKGIARQYNQPEITICANCYHKDVCGDKDYLTQNACCNHKEAGLPKNCAGCFRFDIENRLCKNHDSPTSGRVIENIDFYCSDYDGEAAEAALSCPHIKEEYVYDGDPEIMCGLQKGLYCYGKQSPRCPEAAKEERK